MSEWWTYRPADLLMFSARSYARLFELHHAAVWPAQPVALALGLLMLVMAWRGTMPARRVALVILALAWVGVGWAFHLQRFASIQTAAPWFAAGFGLQGVLLLAAAWRLGPRVTGPRRVMGLALLAFAVLGLPVGGLAFGWPGSRLEVFGITPDATAIATLALLVLSRPGGWTWVLPLAWVAIDATTLWTLHAAEWWVMPAAAMLAIGAIVRPPPRA